jgi:SulP family sulfate permease
MWMPSDVKVVLPAGLGLAFVTSVNLLVTSRVVEHFRGRHQALKKADADRELGAYGIANLAAGMFGAPMSVGIPARSLANVQCGGTTRLSNLLHAGFLILFVVEGASLISHIPLAALAAVTAWMGIRLMEWSMWARLLKMRRLDAAAFLSTALVSLMFNAVAAVALGCSLYGARWAYQTYFHNGEIPAAHGASQVPIFGGPSGQPMAIHTNSGLVSTEHPEHS